MQSGRPKTYKKGPDVMSKSERTQRRHAQVMQGQGRLTGFGFKGPLYLEPDIPKIDRRGHKIGG